MKLSKSPRASIAKVLLADYDQEVTVFTEAIDKLIKGSPTEDIPTALLPADKHSNTINKPTIVFFQLTNCNTMYLKC